MITAVAVLPRAAAAALLVAVAVWPTTTSGGDVITHPVPAGAHHPRAVPRLTRSLTRPVLPVKAPSRPTVAPARAGTGWVNRIRLCIRNAESTNNYRAASPTGKYRGAYQFSRPTWAAVTGLPGTADLYPAAVQDRAFLALFAGGLGRHQWSTYPTCRATLGGPA